MKSECDALQSLIGTAREAVQDAARSRANPLLAQDPDQIGPCVTDMDCYGDFSPQSSPQLPAKSRHLIFSRRVVVIVVEPDFAPEYYLGMNHMFFQRMEIRLVGELGVVRMHSQPGINEIVF